MLNLITISSTWARIIDVMDNEVCLLMHSFCFNLGCLGAHLTCSGFSQVQDYLDLLVLVPLLASFVDHCLPQEWLLLVHVSLHVPTQSFLACFYFVLHQNNVFCSLAFVCCFVDGTCGSDIKRDKL